jgi:hypothetical protein
VAAEILKSNGIGGKTAPEPHYNNIKIIHSENMWLAYNKRLQQAI